jgi:hypothetical protein
MNQAFLEASMSQRITVILLLILACASFCTAAPVTSKSYGASLVSKVGGDDDSLRSLKKLLSEHKQLRETLDSLRRQMDDFSTQIENAPPDTSGEIDRQLTKMDEAIRRTEDALAVLRTRLREYIKESKPLANAEDGVLRITSDTTIAAGAKVDANVVASNCTLTVAGQINGDILVIDGVLLLKSTAVVDGDVTTMHSTYTLEDGGQVNGTVREESADSPEAFGDEGEMDSSWTFTLGGDDDESMGSSLLRRFTESSRWDFPLGTSLAESFIRFNRVEGLYLGIADPKDVCWNSKKMITTNGYVGYGFASHHWRYGGGLYVPFRLNKQIIEVGVEGHSHTDSHDQWRIDRDENSAMAFFAREDFMDYFERGGFSGSVSWYSHLLEKMDMKASLAYVHDTYWSLERNAEWSLFGGDKVFRENPPISEGNLNSFVFMAEMSNTSSSDPKHGCSFHFKFENAGGMAKGDFDFRQYTIDLRHYQPVFSFLDFNARFLGCASSGTVPLQRSFDLGGPSSLQAFGYKAFSGTHGALVNLELIVKSDISRHSSGWLASLMNHINLILFADAGVTNNVASFTHSQIDYASRAAHNVTFSGGFDDMKQWRSDVGFAIGNEGGSFRIGAAWRTDRSEKATLIVRFSRPF